MSKTKQERPPWTSGFCNPTLPRTAAYDPHQNCPGASGEQRCACRADGCPCYTANLRVAIGPGAIMCGEPTQGDLAVVAGFAEALRITDPAARAAALAALASMPPQPGEFATVTASRMTRTSSGNDVTVEVTGDRWVWEADAAAEVMLQGDATDVCPMCSTGWESHGFLDDGRVSCP